MTQPDVQTFAFPNGLSRKGRTALLGRSISGHIRPQVRFPQHTPRPFFLDIFRTVLCFGWCSSPYIYHTPSEAVTQCLRGKCIPALAWLDDFCLTGNAARIVRRSSTSRPLSHLSGPNSLLQMRLLHVVFQVLSRAVYPPPLPGRYLQLTNASLRGSGR